jgi:hypothetical protein
MEGKMSKPEAAQPSRLEHLEGSKRANWKMSVREQGHLHQALLRRRMQQGLNQGNAETTLVFIECADDLGPLYFSRESDYKPFPEPADSAKDSRIEDRE